MASQSTGKTLTWECDPFPLQVTSFLQDEEILALGLWNGLGTQQGRPDSTLETVELEMRLFPAPPGDVPGDTSAAVAPASAHTLVAPRCQRKLQQ